MNIIELAGSAIGIGAAIAALVRYLARNDTKDLISLHNEDVKAHPLALDKCKAQERADVERIFGVMDEMKEILSDTKADVKVISAEVKSFMDYQKKGSRPTA